MYNLFEPFYFKLASIYYAHYDSEWGVTLLTFELASGDERSLFCIGARPGIFWLDLLWVRILPRSF